jgi:DNA-binding response OmpR family regulator
MREKKDSQEKILIVEDDAIIAAHLEGFLVGEGYTVPALADTGEEALAEAQKHRPDLVLMDIDLFGSADGVCTARELSRQFGIPTIFLSGYSEALAGENDWFSACEGFLAKPVRIRELCAAIKKVLERKRG